MAGTSKGRAAKAAPVKKPKKAKGSDLFKHHRLSVKDLAGFEGAIQQIHVGELDLLIIDGVLAPETCNHVVKQLEDPARSFAWTLQEHPDPRRKQFYLLGESLTPYTGHPDGPDLAHYFQETEDFRKTSAELFRGTKQPSFDARMTEVFARMSGGRRVEPGPAGEKAGTRYHAATIRALPPGCEIPVHVGNYFLTTPAYRHLASIVDLKDQLSYFVPLQVPDGGGELVVFRAQWGEPVPEMTREARAGWDERGDLWPAQAFAPGQGSLLLFNGGRFYHRVSTVTGTKTRWTIGGFASPSVDGRTVYYWS